MAELPSGTSVGIRRVLPVFAEGEDRCARAAADALGAEAFGHAFAAGAELAARDAAALARGML